MGRFTSWLRDSRARQGRLASRPARPDAPRWEIDHKVVFSSGAGRGIGAATAVRLRELGASVALVDREGDAVQSLVARLGDRAAWMEADVTDPAALDEAAVEIPPSALGESTSRSPTPASAT